MIMEEIDPRYLNPTAVIDSDHPAYEALQQKGFLREDLDVEGLATPFHAVFIRAPLVERVGAEDVELVGVFDPVPIGVLVAVLGAVAFAVGLALQGTLANFAAGVLIVLFRPYKVGDYVILDGGLRGEVREIGVRSTRILTRDDVEVTVPNAVIATGRIINEIPGISRVTYDISGKPPATIEWE